MIKSVSSEKYLCESIFYIVFNQALGQVSSSVTIIIYLVVFGSWVDLMSRVLRYVSMLLGVALSFWSFSNMTWPIFPAQHKILTHDYSPWLPIVKWNP